MSSSLSAYIRRGGVPLTSQIKYIFQGKYGSPIKKTLSESDCDYLNGLKDAGVDGAETLIELIDKFGEVEIMEEY